MPPLVQVAPPTTVCRLARRSADPFDPPDWAYAADDGTFGNRFDDPSARAGVPEAERFRTIYCASQRAGAFGETLARFRPSLSVLAQLEEIDDDGTDPLKLGLAGIFDPAHPQRGVISEDWRLRRHLGNTTLDASRRFVDITAPASLQHLRRALAPVATKLGLTDIDLSAVTGAQRLFTQLCARYIYDLPAAPGHPPLAGIRYLSRLNPAWECWAIFHDRMQHQEVFPETILPDDPDPLRVASLFELTVETLPGHYIRP